MYFILPKENVRNSSMCDRFMFYCHIYKICTSDIIQTYVYLVVSDAPIRHFADYLISRFLIRTMADTDNRSDVYILLHVSCNIVI